MLYIYELVKKHEQASQCFDVYAVSASTGQLKCDGTRAGARFRLSAKRTSPFKLAGEGGSVQSTTGS